MNTVNILLTACGGHYMRDVIQCYRDIGGIITKVIGVASEPDPTISPLVDGYYKVSPCSMREKYLMELADICREEKIDILVPTMDEELILLRDNVDIFNQTGTRISVSEGPHLAEAVNKEAFLCRISAAGIPHPRYEMFDSVAGLHDCVRKLGYPRNPVCIKAVDKAGSRGFRIIDPNKSLFKMMLEDKPTSRYISLDAFSSMYAPYAGSQNRMMVQEYLPGDEYSVDLIADHGNVLYIGGRRNLVVDNSIPLVSVTEKNSEAYEISKAIVKEFCLDGNANIDFIFNGDGFPIPTEINPRISASIGLYNKAGMNLAGLQIMRMLGKYLPDCKMTEGVEVRRTYTPTFKYPNQES